MKKLLLAAVLATGMSVFSTIPEAAAQQQETTQAVKAENGWMTDFDAALKLAKKDKKTLLVDFTGSDWCRWCILLDKEVFAQKAFQDYAAKNLILVKIDFPKNIKQSDAVKKQNRALAEKYKIAGYPTILLINGNGKVVAKTGYRAGGAENYVKHLQGLLK